MPDYYEMLCRNCGGAFDSDDMDEILNEMTGRYEPCCPHCGYVISHGEEEEENDYY